MLGRFAFSPLSLCRISPNETKQKQYKKTEKATAISELESKQKSTSFRPVFYVYTKHTHTHVRPVRQTIMIECFLPIEKSKTEEEDLKLVRAPQSKDLIIVNHASRAEQEEN